MFPRNYALHLADLTCRKEEVIFGEVRILDNHDNRKIVRRSFLFNHYFQNKNHVTTTLR